jgi:hypothetical protein
MYHVLTVLGGLQFEEWPEGDELIGDFDYVYDANALIKERMNDTHDDDFAEHLDERDLFHLGGPLPLRHVGSLHTRHSPL